MIGALAIVILAMITGIAAILAAYKWRGHEFPLDWRFFVAMAAGAFTVAVFYAGVADAYHDGASPLVYQAFSRLVFLFLLISTLGLAAEALRRKINGNGQKNE